MANEHSISATVLVDAPIERVWELASDTSRYDEWVEATLEVLGTDGPARLGSSYEERTRVSGPWKATTSWRRHRFRPTPTSGAPRPWGAHGQRHGGGHRAHTQE